MRWSSPLLFNDPFDVPRELELGFSARGLHDAVVMLLENLVDNPEALPPSAVGLLTRLLRNDARPELCSVVVEFVRQKLTSRVDLQEELLGQFRSAWGIIVPKLRILCLSEACDSAPMWAHYADQHRGVVLRFQCSDELDSATLLAQPVKYHEDPPKLPSKDYWARTLLDLEEVDWLQFFQQYFYVKAPSWNYEREWRVVSYTRSSNSERYPDMGFAPGELSAVLLGADVTDDFTGEVDGLLAGDLAHVEVHRAELHAPTRTVTFRRLR